MSNIKKEDLLKALQTCAKMESIWYNGSLPDYTFSKSIQNMRKNVLEKMLKPAKVEIED